MEAAVSNFAMQGGMGEVITNFINNEYNFDKKDLYENVVDNHSQMEEEKMQN